MNFAIKVGDKYLKYMDCSESSGGATGHTQFVNVPGGLTLEFGNKPKYYERLTAGRLTNNILDLMRWGDIPLDLIKIIPEEELDD